LTPFTEEDFEKILKSELWVELLDVADVFQDHVWEDKIDSIMEGC
jgi:hypothetical protein